MARLGELDAALGDTAPGGAEAAALRRANRALRVLAAVNEQLDAAAEREEELFAAACRIAVEAGGYIAAWVGVAEHDAERSVRLAAHAGVGREEIERAAFVWSDTPRGESVCGRAIRFGEAEVRRAIGADPRLSTWRDIIDKHDLGALVALPILADGGVFGALTIWARDPDAFDAEEVALLGGLARGVDRALASLRGRAQRRVVERRLESVLGAIQDVVWSMSAADGATLYINGASRHLLGRSPEEMLAERNIFERIAHPDDMPAILTARAEITARGEGAVEHRIIRPDGEVRWVRARLRLIAGPSGVPERIDAVLTDITDKRAVEEAVRIREAELLRLNAELERRVDERTAELSLANAALSRAGRAKDEFLASMSHELRTPLNAVLGLAEALQEEVYGPIPERQRRALSRIEESGRHLLELISDILDLSKIEAGQMTVEVAPVRLAEVCRASLRMIHEAALKKRQTVALRITDDLATLRADERRIKQILVNLLSNAVKFTPEEGKIGLEVEPDEAGEIVRFTVWDTGIGIAPADMGRLFQPFVQLDSTLSRRHAGTGLGLSLVRKLVDLHGGGITVESEPGKGSRFTVVLPRRRPTDAPTPPEGLPAAKRALVVEDSPPVAEQLCRYLIDGGFDPMVHIESEGVVTRAAIEQPAVILLDILLPAETGWNVLRQLKRDARTAHVPVVVISVLDRPDEGLALGAVSYLVKPVTRERLITAVAAATGAGPNELLPMVPPSDPPEVAPRILLAEDDETNIATLLDFLRSRGYEVYVARDGHEAVRLSAEVKPDLILMDVQMPGMDGLTATRAIRAAEARRVPIVAVTALAMAGDRERCLAAGADEYLTKPVSLKVLSAVIGSRLARAAVDPS